MSTEPAEIEPVEDAPVEEAPVEASEENVEDRARRQGWRPQDEFNKDPSEWRTAEEFLEISENEMPVLRQQLRKMEGQIKGMESSMEFQKKEREIALREERERIEAQYNARLRDTVETGDAEAYDRIQREKEERLKPPEPAEDLPVAIKTFMNENEWYGTDEDMTDFANAQNLVVRQRHPDWNDELVMRQIGAQVRQAYPRQFQPKQQTVEGGRRPQAQPKGKTFDNLPDNYKAGFEQSVRAGLVTNDEAGRARFAEVYYDDEENR